MKAERIRALLVEGERLSHRAQRGNDWRRALIELVRLILALVEEAEAEERALEQPIETYRTASADAVRTRPGIDVPTDLPPSRDPLEAACGFVAGSAAGKAAHERHCQKCAR